MQRQQGFTLIEIAIVLVIIGLLLGGVLKGQELINSAKVKNIVSEIKNTSVMVYAYQDRFRALPGDQTAAQLSAGLGAAAAACTTGAPGCTPGNGRIDGDWNANDDANRAETYVMWQHIRLANLASGSTTIAVGYGPRNVENSPIGVESGIASDGTAAPWIAGMRASFYVCTGGIQGRYVRQIDTTMDDGQTNTGSIQATSGTTRASAAVAAADVNDTTVYTVCAGF
ncbi:MAG: hypothetical protein IOMNBAOH_00708 [Rhodocyclaceae bacterium]|nr:hypothetical protein [Rhodocyclaceae bacterium]